MTPPASVNTATVTLFLLLLEGVKALTRGDKALSWDGCIEEAAVKRIAAELQAALARRLGLAVDATLYCNWASRELQTMNVRQQIFASARDLKWIIAISFVVAALLYFPDQVSELYRLSAAQGFLSLAKELVAVFLIAIVIWFGALLLAAESAKRIGEQKLHPWTRRFLTYVPIFLGVLPVVAAVWAQLAAMPRTDKWTEEEAAALRQVGSVFRIEEKALSDDVIMLWACFVFLIAVALLVVFVTWGGGKLMRPVLVKINQAYFRSVYFLLASVAVIAVITAIFVAWPDTPAQVLGTFGVVAVFTLCVTAFCVHISLLTIDHSFPVFPIVFGVALFFAAIGINDNHFIRTLDKPADFRHSAGQAFIDWLSQPERLQPAKSADGSGSYYPVFIVSAEGGGIYAAHNTALFLARMQDLCPGFSRHLFAISSVSGGSVGAAVFTTTLSSAAHSGAAPAVTGKAPRAACDKIARFVANLGSSRADAPGPLEELVDRTLNSDYLSPLVAASLFPDFTQFFLPVGIGPFDRARALEYTLENAVGDALKQPAAVNLMKSDYQSIWTPESGLPALLLNTTDAGSGKRVLIAPFDIDPDHPKDSPLCMLANVKRSDDEINVISSESLHLPLSTAAFMSARFPWVTPAATVDIKNTCITRHEQARLVDGGYIDNSGVETAIDLIEAINSQVTAARKVDPNAVPKFRIYLISLSGGDFPDRVSFSFDDLLEPIRALLNGRSARAYVALNRAPDSMEQWDVAPPADGQPRFDAFTKSNLQNYFYTLPLGWIMSDKTREIVSISSGRFWDCEPNAKFAQNRKFLSNADCIQMQIYHLLNGSVGKAVNFEREQAEIDAQVNRRILILPGVKEVHERILNCYEEKWFHERRLAEYKRRLTAFENSNDPNKKAPPPYRQSNLAYYQSEQVRALLIEWDSLKDSDTKALAYLLGSISYDSNDFTRTAESLSFGDAEQIESIWKNTLAKINAHRAAQTPPLPPVDTSQLTNNPEALANTVWGWPNNVFGNREPGDGYKYRPRGLYQLVGREQYERESQALNEFDPDLKIDILENPDSLFNRRLSAKATLSHFYKSSQYRGQTLAEHIKKLAPDWKKIRALQNDMDHRPSALQRVAERTNMFDGCITAAQKPKPPPSVWAKIMHAVDVFKEKF